MRNEKFKIDESFLHPDDRKDAMTKKEKINIGIMTAIICVPVGLLVGWFMYVYLRFVFLAAEIAKGTVEVLSK